MGRSGGAARAAAWGMVAGVVERALLSSSKCARPDLSPVFGARCWRPRWSPCGYSERAADPAELSDRSGTPHLWANRVSRPAEAGNSDSPVALGSHLQTTAAASDGLLFRQNALARSSTLGSGGTADAPDARVSRHEPHSSHARPRGAASPRRRTRGTRSELLTPPIGDWRTHRPPGEQHRPLRRALPVTTDTTACQALVAASRPFVLASALPPAWQSASGQPVQELPVSLPAWETALAL